MAEYPCVVNVAPEARTWSPEDVRELACGAPATGIIFHGGRRIHACARHVAEAERYGWSTASLHKSPDTKEGK